MTWALTPGMWSDVTHASAARGFGPLSDSRAHMQRAIPSLLVDAVAHADASWFGVELGGYATTRYAKTRPPDPMHFEALAEALVNG